MKLQNSLKGFVFYNHIFFISIYFHFILNITTGVWGEVLTNFFFQPGYRVAYAVLDLEFQSKEYLKFRKIPIFVVNSLVRIQNFKFPILAKLIVHIIFVHSFLFLFLILNSNLFKFQAADGNKKPAYC